MTTIYQEYYKNLFGYTSFNKPINDEYEKTDRIKNALEKAWETRNFEIELYWKRTLYFWGLIVATFAGFFNLLKNNSENEYLLLVSALGVIFSLAWFLVNLGSKFWQANWEAHIEILEDEYYGKLYKTVIKEDEHYPKFSISRINLIVSLFVFLIFIIYFISYSINPRDLGS